MSLTQDRKTRVIALLQSPMNVMGHDNPSYSQCSALTHALLCPPLSEIQKQQEIKDTCAKVLPASRTTATLTPNPHRVASFSAGKTLILFSVLETVLTGKRQMMSNVRGSLSPDQQLWQSTINMFEPDPASFQVCPGEGVVSYQFST